MHRIRVNKKYGLGLAVLQGQASKADAKTGLYHNGAGDNEPRQAAEFAQDTGDLSLKFKCSICTTYPRHFSSKAALGGHVSKAHTGGSEKYNKKLEVRKRREVERECLKEAK